MALNIKKIRAICFDIDGTLNETDDHFINRAEILLWPLKIFLSNWEVKLLARRIVMGFEAPANLVYSWLDALGADHLLAEMMKRTSGKGYRKKNFILVEDTPIMLKQLSKNYHLAIVSARDESSTLEFLEKFELNKYFQVIVTSQTCEHTKPFPDPLLHAARMMGVKAENCLMVGDTTVDMKTGRRAGTQTAGVLCGFGTEKELLRTGADVILSSTADLLEILKH